MTNLLRILLAAAAVASAPPAVAVPALREAAPREPAPLPRVIAFSERFVLTATVERDVMIVHLQQALTRERVTAARIDVELAPIGNGNRGSVRERADPRRDGTYVVRHMLLATPGQYWAAFVLDAGARGDSGPPSVL
jgi:hypothetical protein